MLIIAISLVFAVITVVGSLMAHLYCKGRADERKKIQFNSVIKNNEKAKKSRRRQSDRQNDNIDDVRERLLKNARDK